VSRRLLTLAGLAALAALSCAAPQVAVEPAVEHTGTVWPTLTSSVWRYGAAFERADLPPVPNNNPVPEPQPHRDRPARVALSADGDRAYVTLAGTEADPGHEVAVVRLEDGEVLGRIEVGSRPYGAFLHPGGRFLVVTNELSNYATVIDTATDRAVSEIPLDFYAQGLAFSPRGDRAWVSIRYLDQVLVVDLREDEAGVLQGAVRPVGGFDEDAFFGRTAAAGLEAELRARGYDADAVSAAAEAGSGGINAILKSRCGACHKESAGGFLSGPDPRLNLLSAVDNSVGGDPDASPLLQAVVPVAAGGFGDSRRTPRFHPGGACFEPGEPELEAVAAWIRAADEGPGIRTGNRGAHPKDLALSPDGRHLFVGNTGTQDVAIIDVDAGRQVGGVFVQNVASHVAVLPDPGGERDLLLVATMGAGFGGAKARDPAGAETWDRDHPAAQFSILRDRTTTEPHPLSEQAVLGPFDAVDGTWNFKMRDIGNDLVAVDLSRLAVPSWSPGMRLDYQLLANVYEAHAGWVRYTSDTAEATTGDIKGDIPPELQRVPGAFPEWAAVVGDSVFVSMAGSFEVVEWQVRRAAADPADLLVPVRTWDVGLRPVGVAADERHVLAVNQLGESLTIIDRETGASREVVVGDRTRPLLDTDAEKGELVVHTAVFSSDGDTSCLHCHYRDTGDGRGWGAAETIGQERNGHFTVGGTLGIPQMRNVFAIQPYYFEGTHRLSEGQGADVNEPASSIDFDRPIWAGDYTGIDSPVPPSERRPMHEELKERVEVNPLGDRWYPLEERRDTFLREQSLKHFGAAYGLRDLHRFVAAWLGAATHLLPNPFDEEHPSVVRGRLIFDSAEAMCSECHTRPEFTNKGPQLTHNARRALPQLTTVTPRDASYTLVSVRALDRANGVEVDLDPDDVGRVEGVEGSFTTMQLRGIFDRPPVFLHHGRARSLREVVASPGHPGLGWFRLPVFLGVEDDRPGRREVGFNETTTRGDGDGSPATQIADTHGGTSHLGGRELEDLVRFMEAIE